MSTAVSEKTRIPDRVDTRILTRILEEGYGPGAWHGNDMKAAISDVADDEAFWRPDPERHNIAELVLHHAYYVHQVRAQLSGRAAEPFVLKGEDWFQLPDESVLEWSEVKAVLHNEQQRLTDVVITLGTAGSQSAGHKDAFDLVLGITCHAVYHAAQIQLLKKLRDG